MKLSAIGITPQKEKQFNGKGIFSVEDMVRYLPQKIQRFQQRDWNLAGGPNLLPYCNGQ